MDFRLVDNLVSSLSASNNGGTHADVSKLRFLNRECTDAENHLPAAKLARVSCNNGGGGLTQQMLGFSAAFPFLRSSSGYGLRGPFTPSQWMELEHQALIYKYITANVPIPSYLLNPIRKALEHSRFSCFSLLRPNALGWGGFDKSTDPEPGRCRRTDGKKWRCSRDVVADQKYCERHINRGRHRSRKPVEGGATTNNHISSNRCPIDKETPRMHLKDNQQQNGIGDAYSLLNPLDRTELSMGLGVGVGVGVGVGAVASEQSQRWGGGPLGEALHTMSNGSGQCKALNLIPSNPLGVLGGAFAGTG